MPKVEHWFKQDLKNPVKVHSLNGSVFTLDNVGSVIGVEVFDSGNPVALTGTVNGYVILPDDTTISVVGTRSNNKASINLPQSALAIPGFIKIAVKLTNSSEITTLLAVVATVYKSRTDTIITPSQQIITDWSQQISAEMQAVEDASAAQDAKIDELKSALSSGFDVHFYEGVNLAGKTIEYDYATSPLRKPGYMDKYGAIQGTSSTNRYIQFPSYGVKSITITPTANTTTLPFAIYTDKNGTNPVVLINGDITSATTYTFDEAKDGFITLNYFPTGNNFPSSATLVFFTFDEMNTALKETDRIWGVISGKEQTIQLSTLDYYGNGYINNYGEIITTSGSTHWVVSMDASNLSHIEYQPTGSPASNMGFGVIKDANGNKLLALTFNGTNKISVDVESKVGNVLYVAFYNHATVPNPYYSSFKIIESLGNDSTAEPIYMSCVAKPITVTGKKLYFFGDSITYGYIAASGGTPAHQATNNYPKVFSESVRATYVNFGVSGSTLSGTGVASIYTKITETNLNPSDVVFVAGGINDWQTGVDASTLATAVENICSYLSQNYSKPVVFITPINEAGRVPTNLPTQSVQNVRNIITRIALKYGYSVVQGWEFPFPTYDDDSDYISLMFQDKLHPTELGYAMYAQALRNALC